MKPCYKCKFSGLTRDYWTISPEGEAQYMPFRKFSCTARVIATILRLRRSSINCSEDWYQGDWHLVSAPYSLFGSCYHPGENHIQHRDFPSFSRVFDCEPLPLIFRCFVGFLFLCRMRGPCWRWTQLPLHCTECSKSENMIRNLPFM